MGGSRAEATEARSDGGGVRRARRCEARRRPCRNAPKRPEARPTHRALPAHFRPFDLPQAHRLCPPHLARGTRRRQQTRGGGRGVGHGRQMVRSGSMVRDLAPNTA